MNRNVLSVIAVVAAFLLTACNKTVEYVFADKGPQMTVQSYSEKVNMGGNIKFSVDVKDDDFALSTLKAKLMFDETEVSSISIRTKENGVYEDVLEVPLLKDIPDGIASVIFVAQNVGQAITSDTVYVDVARPNPETVTLVDSKGNEFTMSRTEDYKYELTKLLPKSFSVFAKVPSLDEENPIVLGWDGKELVVGGDNPIPFSASNEAEYTVNLDLMALTASPFNKLISVESNLSESATKEILRMYQNGGIVFKSIPNIKEWDLDTDFFSLDENDNVVFKAVSGYYRLIADFPNAFIKVEPVVDEKGENLVLGEKCDGAVWVIGKDFGKPSIGPSWNTESGAYAAAQVAPKTYQITLNVGSQLGNTPSLKVFHQKGWGGEFTSYAEFDGADVFKVTASGNIELAEGKTMAENRAYRFTLDLTSGLDKAKMTVLEVEAHGGKALDIFVNDVKADKLSRTLYKVKAVSLKKNSAINVKGVEDWDAFYFDQDHFVKNGKQLTFNAVDGFYSVEMNLEDKYVTVRRVKENGTPATFKDEGAVTIMGWGLAHPRMTSQLAWDSGLLITLAEVEPGKYQFTGKAVGEKSEEIGGRLRYDYMSFKLFGQAGWGVEMDKNYVISANAETLGFQKGGNIEFDVKKTQKTLEQGATYRLIFEIPDKTINDNKFKLSFDCVKL